MSINFTDESHPYSAEELTGLLDTVRFRQLAVFGDPQGAPYDEKATRLCVVAYR